MHVFVYEDLTAQGLGRAPNSPGHSMYLEGRAMRDAIAEDLSRVEDVEVSVVAEEDVPLPQDGFEQGSREADWTFLIAPELGGRLLHLAASVERVGGRLLGPSVEAIRLTSDKVALFEFWRKRGVPTPATTEREPGMCEAFPVVWKPRDGAGSTRTYLLQSSQDVVRVRASLSLDKDVGPRIMQEYVPGLAASISFLCGPQLHLALPPASQLLSSDGSFQYLGGEIPLEPRLAERALQLGRLALQDLPGLLGFIGIDLVLGDREDGSRDFAIEINPRLTTSYLGLRELASTNLAETLLALVQNERIKPFRWKNTHIRFGTGGDDPKGYD